MDVGRSLGVEEELHLVDRETSRLAPLARQVLGSLPDEGFAAELQRSTVETNTVVCHSLEELHRAVTERRRGLIGAAGERGLAVIAAGTSPLHDPIDFELTPNGRFSRMQQDYRLLVDEHLVCSLQVHVGIASPDLAVRILPRLEATLPILLGLSASSPFWHGQDSGYASVRSTMWQRWPTAGRAPWVGSHAEYQQLIEVLIANGTISDAKMTYFDIRPSPKLPTLELRVCDACPLVDDVVLIAALFRAAVDQAVAAEESGEPVERISDSLYRAAMWRAARSGLSGSLLDGFPDAMPAPAFTAVNRLLDRLRPQLEAEGNWEAVQELASAALSRGTSSERQRARNAATGSLEDVAALLIDETAGRGAPGGPATAWTDGYRSPAVDEAVRPSGVPVPVYEPVFAALDRLDPVHLATQAKRLGLEAAQRGLTFRVSDQQRPFPVDIFPRVITAQEWNTLGAGLTQRARALEAYIRDAYGPAQIVRDSVMTPDMLSVGHGWRPEARLLPGDVMRAPVMGFDLVRDDNGGWRVLEDNVRVPSGVGYAIALRRLARRALPELSAGLALRNPDTVPALLAKTLEALTPASDPVLAMLSEGADNSAWFEHQLLSREAGLLLTNPQEIEVRGDRVVVGDQAVDVLYLRLESELLDLMDSAGRPIGARVFEVARQGRVAVVNAPGNGIADDKAVYCHVPDLIAYYLGERPLIAQVPTYRCADPAERLQVLDRLDQLVTKPVGGYGGSGVLIGPDATAEQLGSRRTEILARPADWVAQETVPLSTVPTLVNGRLEPRHVDLRGFVYLSGPGPDEAELADLALTRVGPAGSMVVNSSRGGGAKDTWILAGVDAEAEHNRRNGIDARER